MRARVGWLVVAVAAGALATGAWPVAAPDREYYVNGSVVDGSNRPLEGVAIEIRDRASRRAYMIRSDKQGSYKFVGLPHGTYDVSFSKAGYQSRTTEWDLREAQDSLRKVRFDPLVLLSDTQVTEIKRDSKLKSELDEASALIKKGDCGGALVVLAKMLAESPDDVNALFLSGVCQLQSGKLEAAATSLEKVVQLSPDFAAARVQLGACYERRGDKERALTSYDAALKLEPDNTVALYNAGVLHYNAGRAPIALPYFERLVRVKPEDDSALEMAGYCQLQAANYPAALACFERARALVTDPARAATLDEVLKELRPRVAATPATKAP